MFQAPRKLCLALAATSLFNISYAQTPKDNKVSSKSFTVFAAGDIADCRKKPAEQTVAAHTASIVELGLAQDKNAYAITLGDNTYPIGKPSEFSDCYDWEFLAVASAHASKFSDKGHGTCHVN